MPVGTTSSGAPRDLQIDFFRGLALIFIFVDHVPGNDLARFTLRNFGFADAAEVFVLLAGFSAVLAYGRTFENDGFRAGTARVLDRVRDIYVWHLGLVAVCGVGADARRHRLRQSHVREEHRRPRLRRAAGALHRARGLARQSAQHAEHPAALHRAAARVAAVDDVDDPAPALVCPFAIGRRVGLANLFDLNLPSQQNPKGWVFNPFAWQLLVTIGALTAYFSRRGPVPVSRALIALAIGFLVFAFLMAAPWTQIPALEHARSVPARHAGPDE